MAASRHLPAGQGERLLAEARAAFTVALHVNGVIAAVIFTGLAVLMPAMRPAGRTSPAVMPGCEVARSPDGDEGAGHLSGGAACGVRSCHGGR